MRRSTSSQATRRDSKNGKETPPFPTRQMFVLACCRICEPIAFMSIFPYIYYMIKSFGITSNKSEISVYAGMVTSAFTLAEFSTGVLWGRLSDKIGRKPVLLTGLVGTAISVLIFGFAKNLWVALFARALGGLLNGNIGVLQTTVAELVTVKEQQPRAYTIMPMVWCIGSIIGPMIGGALAEPCTTFPSIFPRGTIWEEYPFLLPNLFSAAAVFVGVVVGVLFLEETHAMKKHERDRGRELGDRLLSVFWKAGTCQSVRSAEKQSLLANDELASYGIRKGTQQTCHMTDTDDQLPAYQSQENSPKLGPQRHSSPVVSLRAEPLSPKKVKIFTKPVIMNIMSYGILAFHTMTFDQLFPVFLSTDKTEYEEPHLPFKFKSGMGYGTPVIGVIMSVQGVYSLFCNYLIVPSITRRLGSLRLFRILAFSYFSLYLITPYVVLLPENMRMPAIYLLVIWKCTFATMAYPSNAILLANSAPSKQVLGTINGIAASTASLCRALGPTLSGILYSMGLRTGYSGLAWWFSGIVTLLGAYLSSQITEGTYQSSEPAPEEEDMFDDSLLGDFDDDESV